MKSLITNYTFSASGKTVTFTNYTSIALERILLITNVTDNIIIYNFLSHIFFTSLFRALQSISNGSKQLADDEDEEGGGEETEDERTYRWYFYLYLF